MLSLKGIEALSQAGLLLILAPARRTDIQASLHGTQSKVPMVVFSFIFSCKLNVFNLINPKI